MKFNIIIAEYNPFHNGHAYQLADAKKATGADATIVLMSGNYVQRGTPAIVDKYTRAKMALLGGADIVLELPLTVSCGSAGYFADGAVRIIKSIAADCTLCFGCEETDAKDLQTIAEFLSTEPEPYKEFLRTELKSGFNFPVARNRAIAHFIPNSNNILDKPNNLLAIEYLKAMLAHGLPLSYHATKRIGSYHADELSGPYSSATAIRSALISTNQIPDDSLPSEARFVLQEALQADKPITEDDFTAVLYKALTDATSLSDYEDVTADFENKIRKYLPEYISWQQLCMQLKSKDITYTRISRALLHILLNLKKSDYETSFGFVNLLGFRKDASQYLGAIGKSSPLLLLSKPADARQKLTASDYELFQKQLAADSLYDFIRASKSKTPRTNPFTQEIVII